MAREHWYTHLRNEAHRLLKDYVQLKQLGSIEQIPLPVPLADITRMVLGFDHLFTDQLEPEVSGFIDFEQELIQINTRDRSVQHQHFSFGHEIGHGRLHRDQGIGRAFRCLKSTVGAPSETAGIDWSKVNLAKLSELRREEQRAWEERKREIEANVFGSALVVPGVHLLQRLDAGEDDPVRLARLFGVSVPAMRWRLEDVARPAKAGQLDLFSA